MLNTNTAEFANQVKVWLNENSPVTSKNNIQSKSLTDESVLVTSPEVSTNKALSSAVVTGNFDYKTADYKMKNAMKNNWEEAIRIFKENPLLGCTTILDMARVSSGYDPNDDMKGTNQDNYNHYLKKVLECPFFHLKMNEKDDYNRNENSWEDAINQIADMFSGVPAADKDKITQSIKNLANAVTSKANTKQGTSIFSVSAIYADDGKIETYIYHSNISMCESKSKGSDCKQTELTIFKTCLELNYELWPVYAEEILERHFKAVGDWIDANSSKQGTVKTKLCIGGYKEI